MRCSLFAVLSGLAALTVVSALPAPLIDVVEEDVLGLVHADAYIHA